MIDYMLAEGKKISTFSVADAIIAEHFENNVQVVMLSETVHEQVHENNIFINLKQAFGNLNAFLTKYKKGLQQEQVDKINKYIKLSEQYDSFDKHVLDLKDSIKSWSKY
jgi:hypothetical protein